MDRGRPKLNSIRDKRLDLRLSEDEFNKIERVAKQKNLSKTDAILQAIDIFELYKPKKFKNLSAFKDPKDEEEI